MSPKKQRIAIAEACGWAVHDAANFFGRHENAAHSATIPDYPRDHNAMHEAVMTLDDEQITKMAEILGVNADDAPVESWRILLRASASQLADAFVRTIGKREDDK